MNSHVSAILLGVRDMERSKRFYTEGLGWKIQDDYKISVFFVPHGGSMVGFYGRDHPQARGQAGMGAGTAGRSRIPTATSGASATAPPERTSPTPNSEPCRAGAALRTIRVMTDQISHRGVLR